jgi:putative endonuclease
MEREYHFWVYITTNWKKTVLYVGVTNDLRRRLAEHYSNRGNQDTFAGRYYCYNLVYYEEHPYVETAINREKEIKHLLRDKKESLIQEFNPDWRFLNTQICGAWPPKIAS